MTRPYTVVCNTTPETLLTDLLVTRGVMTRDEQEAFCRPDYDRLHDPLLLHDMPVAIKRIMAAVEAEEHIAIFSDYDCDGIPGAVVLHDCFTAIGHKNFSNVIPHRHYEGFGLSVEAVHKMADAGATLIITIDCGTTDVEAVAVARERGVDVIVTDHHEPGAILPNAVAIVNPKLGEYPFPHLCGAGVAFKVAQALVATEKFTVTPGQEKWWLDMVGIATIADMVPLVGENRILAHFGLLVLRKSRRLGLQQLLRKNRIPQQYLTEEDIGFTIGPRINAASRMDAPEDAFHLLTATEDVVAGHYVDHLERLNTDRKTAVALMTREIHGRMRDLIEVPPVIVMGNPLWRPALVGLAANKLAEEYNRPVFLWGRDGNEVIKGSCRSGNDVSVVKLMEATASAFIEFGGHHASGGFSVYEPHIHTLPEQLIEMYTQLGASVTIATETQVDAELRLQDISRVKPTLATLAPFGSGHHRPLFAFPSVQPVVVEQFGKGSEHTKLVFKVDRDTIEGIAFFTTPDRFTHSPQINVPCTVLAHIEDSFFAGRRSTRLRIVDIV